MNLFKKSTVLIIFLFEAFFLTAQDGHYWSSNFTPGDFFTPGAVVAYNGDSGVHFYNPALLGFNRKNAVTISGNIYRYEVFKTKDALGKGLDLSSKKGQIIPLIASNTLFLNIGRPISFSFGLITRPVIIFNSSARADAVRNVLNDSYSPGNEDFIGQVSSQARVSETIGFLSAGTQINKKLAVGFSSELIVRTNYVNQSFRARAIINDASSVFPPFTFIEQMYEVDYTYAGLRLKLGAAYHLNKTTNIGLMISTPLLKVYSDATILSDISITNFKQNFITDLLASARQQDLKAKWRAPLSIAFGYSKRYRKKLFYIGGEYFFKLKQYNVITPRNEIFIRPNIPNLNTSEILQLVDERKALLNIALGYSFPLKKNVSGFFSFKTDFNNLTSNIKSDTITGTIANIALWDNYHFQFGANLIKRKYNLKIGLLLTYGGTTRKYSFNFDTAKDTNYLQGESTNRKGTHFVYGILLSYIHNL